MHNGVASSPGSPIFQRTREKIGEPGDEAIMECIASKKRNHGQVPTGGRGSIPGSPSPSIFFAYEICTHEKVSKQGYLRYAQMPKFRGLVTLC